MSSKSMQRLFWGGIVAVVGLSPAYGQPSGGEQPEPPTDPAQPDPVAPGPIEPSAIPPPVQAGPQQEVRTQPDGWRPRTGFGAAVLLGGGVGNFIDDGVDATTGLGGGWNLRLVSGTRMPVGFELGYVGDAHDVTGPGITDDDFVLRSGLEGALRLQVPIERGSALIEPFALVGIGWSQYSLLNESPDVTFMGNSDHQLVVPVGAGLAASYRGFMFDARFTYRLAADDEMFGAADMSGWNVGASLGAEF